MITITTAPDDHKLFPTVGLVVTIILAFTGYFATYVNSLRLAKRKEKLDFLNRQLAEYYGPLYALLLSNQMAYESFRKKYNPGPGFFDSKNAENIAIFRHYTKEISMPANEKILEVIVSKSDLLIEDEMPECLKELMAHIVIYRAVVKNWDKTSTDDNFSINSFPIESSDYINHCYRKLKKQQTAILNKKGAFK